MEERRKEGRERKQQRKEERERKNGKKEGREKERKRVREGGGRKLSKLCFISNVYI